MAPVAIATARERSSGRRRACEVDPHGGALASLNLGRYAGHTQDETGIAQRHMARAGPPPSQTLNLRRCETATGGRGYHDSQGERVPSLELDKPDELCLRGVVLQR